MLILKTREELDRSTNFLHNANWFCALLLIIKTPGDVPGTDVGPMISPEAKQRAFDLVESGVRQGARLLLDGRNVQVKGYPNGNWMGPTILDNVTTDMDCYKEEIFGPVLVCLKAETIDEVINTVVSQ